MSPAKQEEMRLPTARIGRLALGASMSLALVAAFGVAMVAWGHSMKMPNRGVSWVAVLFGLAILCVGVARCAHTPASHTVIIDGARYGPAASTARVGDRITWINKDLVPHTVTSRAGGFDSGAISPGASWTFTATRAGEFPYTCAFHPTMHAVLHVR